MSRPSASLLNSSTRKLGLFLLVSFAFTTIVHAQTCINNSTCNAIMESLSLPTTGSSVRLSILNTNSQGEYPIEIVPEELAAKAFNVAIAGFANPGDPNRMDQVIRFGWNLGLGGQRNDPTDGALGLEFESHYVPSAGNQFFEHHFAYVNKSNVVYRPLSWQINKNTDYILGGITSSKFSWFRPSDFAQWMVFQPFQINFNGTTTLLHTGNNIPFIRQFSSTGIGVSLIYLNQSDQISIASGGQATIFGGNVGIGGINPTSKLYVNGSFTATGPKSALVETTSYGKRKLYAMESPENWFEDFGSAKLTDGQVIVELDQIFTETVNTEMKYYVFLTPNEDCTLYVTQKKSRSFTVVLRSGALDCDFDYRVAAKRKGYERVRLEGVAETKPETQAAEVAK